MGGRRQGEHEEIHKNAIILDNKGAIKKVQVSRSMVCLKASWEGQGRSPGRMALGRSLREGRGEVHSRQSEERGQKPCRRKELGGSKDQQEHRVSVGSHWRRAVEDEGITGVLQTVTRTLHFVSSATNETTFTSLIYSLVHI